jgi:hypothetical protein
VGWISTWIARVNPIATLTRKSANLFTAKPPCCFLLHRTQVFYMNYAYGGAAL